MFRKAVLGSLVVLVAVFSPVSFRHLFLQSSAEDEFVEISEDTEWSGAKTIAGYVFVDPEVTLTIKEGTVLTFQDDAIVDVQGTLAVNGTVSSPVIFKKSNAGNPDESYSVWISQEGQATVHYADISGGGSATEASIIGERESFVPTAHAMTFYTGAFNVYDAARLSVEDTTFHDNAVAVLIETYGGAGTTVNRSRFVDNAPYDVVNNKPQIRWNFQYNWWGRPEGPDAEKILNTVDTANFLTTDPALATPSCTENCFSNVLFLPGILGSRLYDADGSDEDELWVSSSSSRQERMEMNSDGTSKNNVYTKDDTTRENGEIDEDGLVDDTYGNNLYESFIDDLKDWKEEGVFSDYAFIPYDWRLSPEDVVMNGQVDGGKLSYTETNTDLTESYLYQQAKALQASSKSGKLTLIGHSNGGLVIKAFVQKLKDADDPLYSQIDKIVFVGVPQTGTPDSVVSMLYGTKLGMLWLGISAKMSRALSHSMPSMYDLLPSEKLFGMIDPLVEFTGDSIDPAWTERYGDTIDTYQEFQDFLTGQEGRERPDDADTSQPEVLSDILLNKAEADHDAWDDWTPAPETEVIQIAGWGLYTVSGLTVEDEQACQFDAGVMIDGKLVCSGKYTTTTLKDKLTLNGDQTVIVPSALAMGEGEKVKKYWVDLARYNDAEENALSERKHKSILEVNTLRLFIKSLIQNSENNFQYISDAEPSVPADTEYTKYEVHSPLHLTAIDADGNQAGWDTETDTIVEHIRGAQYFEIGEVKTLLLPKETEHTVKLIAYEQGSFTLDIEELDGEVTVSETKFEAIPVLEDSVVDVVPALGDAPVRMSIDFDADGDTETEMEAVPGETAEYENPEIPDTTPPEITVTFDQETKDVAWKAVDNQDENPTVVVTATDVIATDKSGNATTIPFTKYREGTTRLKVQFEKVVYNAEETELSKTTLVYDWKLKSDKLTDLDTELRLKDKSRLKAEYRKSKGETRITEKDKQEKTKIVTTKPGLVSVTVETEQGDVSWKY